MLWGEAVMIVVYIVNRTPASSMEGRTPEEVWLGKLVDYSPLRTFGCAAYYYQSLGKLKPRSLKSIFMGCPEQVKGYKLWVRENKGF